MNELLKEQIRFAKTKKLFEIAREVIAGKWGNGLDRIKKLEIAGYDSAKVQNIVNVMLMEKKK